MDSTLFVSCLSTSDLTAQSISDAYGALHERVEGACGVAKCSERKLQRTSADACHSSKHMGMLALSTARTFARRVRTTSDAFRTRAHDRAEDVAKGRGLDQVALADVVTWQWLCCRCMLESD